MKLKARELLLKLGEAKGRYRAAWRLVDFQLPEATTDGIATFSFALNRQKLRQARRREGRYLLRTNLCGREPAELWQFYLQLVEIEAAFKNLGRLGATSHFSPTRASHRSAHLCGFHRLLSARNLAGPIASARPRADATDCVGQICYYPDARCALSDHRRSHPDTKPLITDCCSNNTTSPLRPNRRCASAPGESF